MKAKTILIDHNDEHKSNIGESVICIQGDKENDRIMVNMDWSFDNSWTKDEIKSMLGGFLGNIEDIFGEKMVTEMIAHWGEETGKLVKVSPTQAVVYGKSHGQEFKK